MHNLIRHPRIPDATPWQDHVLQLLADISLAHALQRVEGLITPDREVCSRCGCLCLPDEHCPMCTPQAHKGVR
jgi:hypothetical protein